MFVLLSLGVGAALLLLIQWAISNWAAYAARRSAIQRHGCQEAPKYPHRDAWGNDLVQDRTQARNNGKGDQIYQLHFARHGKTFEEHFGRQKTITTMEAANYQHVLGTAAKNFPRIESPNKRKLTRKMLGDGILTSVGAEWKQHRTLITPIFGGAELSDVSFIEKHMNRLLQLIPRNGATIDAQDLLQRMFMDIAGDFLLGESLDVLDPHPCDETKAFLKSWDWAMAGLGRWRNAPTLWFFRSMLPNDFDRACQSLHQKLDKFVYRALRDADTDSQTDKEFTEGRSRYIFINEAAKHIHDPAKLRAEVANIFLVARDNVAMATANALFQIARHPHIWTELRRVSLALGNQPLTFELLRSLPMFRYVYNETLRMQGPAIPAIRRAVNDSILPTGGGSDGSAPIFVEKGTLIHCNNWSLHHDPAIWGPDAEAFDPYRWKDRKPPIWAFVPFGGGPRICPALQQVYTYVVYVLVRLTREFERIENRDPVLEYVSVVMITSESRNGVKIALIPAKDST